MNSLRNSTIISWIFPVYIVLIYYVFGFGSIGEWLLIFLAIISFRSKIPRITPLSYLITFIILSDVSLIIYTNGDLSSSFFNRESFLLVQMLSLFFLSSNINHRVITKAIYILALIVSLGVLYHVFLISLGQAVSTIAFVSFEASRFSEVVYRPLSVFPEPAAIVSFLIIPLYLLMNDGKIFYSILLSIVILLTTSSTGIYYLLVMWAYWLLKSENTNLVKWSIIFTLFIVIITFLTTNTFKSSSEKISQDLEDIQTTDFQMLEGNIRLFSGPLLFSTLNPAQILFGLRSSSVDDYVNNSTGSSLDYLKIGRKIFLPSFWLIWASYGLVGLILYLNIFYRFYKKNKRLAPLMLVLVTGMFIQKIGLGPVFMFYFIFLSSDSRFHNNVLQ